MKRDMDLIRLILLSVEKKGNDHNGMIEEFHIENYDNFVVTHHVWLLSQAGLLEAYDSSSYEETTMLPRCLTWQGQEFLSDIKDQEVWQQTKDAARKGGSETLEFLWAIAKAILKKQIESRTGLPLD